MVDWQWSCQGVVVVLGARVAVRHRSADGGSGASGSGGSDVEPGSPAARVPGVTSELGDAGVPRCASGHLSQGRLVVGRRAVVGARRVERRFPGGVSESARAMLRGSVANLRLREDRLDDHVPSGVVARPALVRRKRAMHFARVAPFGIGPLGPSDGESWCLRPPVAVSMAKPEALARSGLLSERSRPRRAGRWAGA